MRVESAASRDRRALPAARERLVRVHRDLLDQVRGLPRSAGLVLPRATPGRLAAPAAELLERAPGLRPAVLPLLAARAGVAGELAELDAAVVRAAAAAAAAAAACRRLATIPGVGAVTAAGFVAAVDDPGRFASPDKVAAYLGLTPRRWRSGEVDHKGGIAKAGDAMVRHLLYEAADSLLARVERPCALEEWALRLQERVGGERARVALARKLAVPMHRLWTRGATFDRERGAAAPA